MRRHRLIHLNGPPGVGKSTLAAQYATDHPGTLNCEVDQLRGLVAGVEQDFAGAGALIRPAAVAMISAYLEHSGDVVLPQMIASGGELDRFRRAATDVGCEHVHVMLTGDPDEVAGRFARRPTDVAHHRRAAAAVAEDGGSEALLRWHGALADLASAEPGTIRLATQPDDIGATYLALLAALRTGRPED